MHTTRKSAEYRADIDGLRAIAVMSVLLFHVDIAFFSGGFVGVDIFFVISGFLITGNITSDIERGSWSFKGFYVRRCRRLFPAYIFTIFSCFVFAFLLFSPTHFQRFCQSLLFSMAYASNFFFWSEADYFDVSSNFKPLLHMWSLAVEEQFYLVWPLSLFFLMRIRHKAAVPVAMLVVGALSLVACEYYLSIDRSAVFYLLPFRIFEFALGGMLTLLVSSRREAARRDEPILAIGLMLIAYSVFNFDEATDFPGLNALVPCIGATLAIYSGRARYLGVLLRNRVSVGIGLVSYSAYLAHWPLVIFYKYWAFSPLTPVSQAAILFGSLFMAYFMYKYIEQPFRGVKGAEGKKGNNAFFATSMAAMLLVGLPAAHAWKNEGWEWRVPRVDQGAETSVHLPQELPNCKPPQCRFGARTDGQVDVLIIGDSHSRALWTAFDYLGKKHDLSVLGWQAPGCYPVFDSVSAYDRKVFLRSRCHKIVEQWEDLIATSKPRYVFLAGRWALATGPAEGYGLIVEPAALLLDPQNPVRTYEESRHILSTRLEKTVARINELGSDVLLLSQVPNLGVDPDMCLDIPTYLYSDSFDGTDRCQYVTYKKMRERLEYSDNVIRRIAADHSGAHAILLSDLLCDEVSQTCKVFEGSTLMYRDNNHLNRSGSLIAGMLMESELERILSDR